MGNVSGHPPRLSVESKAASFTLTAKDSGKLFVIAAVDIVADLPPVDATMDGVFYEFFIATASASTGFSISPAAADQIRGKGLTAADNKDLINTAATDAVGDFVRVTCDGSAGWLVSGTLGTWAREA